MDPRAATVAREPARPGERPRVAFTGSPDDGDADLAVAYVRALRRAGDAVGVEVLGAGTLGRPGYVVAAWAWDLDTPPPGLLASLGMVDEVWVPSRFNQAALAEHTDRPVLAMPLPVGPRGAPEAAGARLAEGFCFCCVVDFDLGADLSNAAGLLDAFCRAFPSPDGPDGRPVERARAPGEPAEPPLLFFGIANASLDPRYMARLLAVAARRPDVIVLDASGAPGTAPGLIAQGDCYVSLHRSDGRAWWPAEAMAAGKPVVATAFSANMDFMTPGNSFLAPVRRAPVPQDSPCWLPGATWAEPDLAVAASLLRQVWAMPEQARVRAARGRREVLATRGEAEATARMRDRLAQITAHQR